MIQMLAGTVLGSLVMLLGTWWAYYVSTKRRRRKRHTLRRKPLVGHSSDPYRGHLRVVAEQQSAAPVKVYCRDCRFRHEERWDEYYCTAIPLPREQWSGRKLTACGDANREHDCKHFQPGIRSWWERRHSA